MREKSGKGEGGPKLILVNGRSSQIGNFSKIRKMWRMKNTKLTNIARKKN
jgi:hypothetical protein